MERGKRNIKRWLLMVAVAAIWGYIAYKVVEFIKDNSNQTPDIPFVERKIQEKNSKEKDYTLLLSYNDPFLKENGSTIEAREVVHITPPIPVRVMWPQLKYNGYLKNGKDIVGMLELNGEYKTARKGDEVGEVRVMAIYEDSISLKYKSELKTFSR